MRWIVSVLFSVACLTSAVPGLAQIPAPDPGAALAKLDPVLQMRAFAAEGRSLVIVSAQPGLSVDSVIVQLGGTLGRSLPIIEARVADMPDSALILLAENPAVRHVATDRLAFGMMERTATAVGATWIRETMSYDGAGIGVALVDSGITAWHDDLTDAAGTQRVSRFVDLVNDRASPYDDYGHGTHVAGIIAGNGFDSGGARMGIAPGAQLVVLKALDHDGAGRISNIIAAFDFVVANKDALNIRVVNVSAGAAVYESYHADPLALAARRVVERGIVVVAAAGNRGRNAHGEAQYGGITAPGNAPWVLTVGASSHMGTADRSDDAIASFSSRGPTSVDYAAKPDLVAPGVGIESLSDPQSRFYSTRSSYLLSGTLSTTYLPYLSLSGTSMAAPVVAGTVALMLQANPALTPSAVKGILQYTAQLHPEYDALTQGAGFLNARGAVELARYFNDPVTLTHPATTEWARHIIWGTHLLTGGELTPDANAWRLEMVWGASGASSTQAPAWGIICSDTTCDPGGSGWITWAMSCAESSCTPPDSEHADSRNVVWGSRCGGADCSQTVWASEDGDIVVWGTDGGDTVVWGTDEGDTVVWGTGCGGDCEPVIWGG